MGEKYSFKVYNDSQGDLLIYGLSIAGFIEIPFEASQLCDVENVGLGLGVIIYDNAGAQLSSTVRIVDRYSDPPMTKSRLDSTLTAYRNRVAGDPLVFRRTHGKVLRNPLM